MDKVQSLARGLEILDLLSQSENGMGATEVGNHLNINKSSASRLMQTLAAYGYIEQHPDTRRYSLGARLVNIGQSVLNRFPLRDQARPYLTQLTQATGECSHVAILAQGRALYIDQVESPSILRVETEIGILSPLHCTALGKVLLAANRSAMPEELTEYTPLTITDRDTLEAHLDEIATNGYAVDDEEHVPGVRCVAAPVFGFRKQVIGSIGISGPAGRVTDEKLPEFKQQVISIANKLSYRMGYAG